MGIECKNCGTMNPAVETKCVSCGETLDRSQVNIRSPKTIEGSSWAGVLSIFLFIFGVILFIVNLVYLITVDGHGIWDFLLVLLILAFYFVFFAALIEMFDNVALTKSYMKKNHEYLKKISEKENKK